MKKILIVLGMLTCLLGMTACGQKEEAAIANPLMTEDEAKQATEQLITQMAEVVEQGMVDYYKEDPVLSVTLESWVAAMEDMGEYQEITDYDVDIKDDGVTIVAAIKGTLRDGKVEIVLDDSLNISSITTTATKTMGELMTNAALNTLLGMGTVFSVLILIMFVIMGFRVINRMQDNAGKKKENPAAKAVDNTIAQIIENEELADDAELVAVIAAAIAASEGAASTDGFVVRSIKRASTNKWQRA